jgi:hypothetical protein
VSGAGFSVGEVAVYVGPTASLHGRECTIIGGLQMRSTLFNYGRIGMALRYDVRFPDGVEFHVRAEYLRKRRPPQDWEKLCRLTDRPVEEPA